MDDNKLVLDKDAFAALWTPEEGYYFCIPWHKNNNDEVPDAGLALIAAVMRLDSDREFYQECLDWFRAQKKAAS